MRLHPKTTEVTMLSRKTLFQSLAAGFVSLGAIALNGLNQPLRAADTGACIIGGSGPLCKQVQSQVCTDWSWGTIGLTSSGFTVGVVCSRWTTTTTYYYWDGGSGGVTIKPSPDLM
jgi:hypothetical protein